MTVAPRARLAVVEGRTTWTSAPPVVLRRTGRRRVHVVQVGGGPLGGDHLGLEVDLGAEEHLSLRGAAATVVQPGRDPEATASLDVTVRLGPGAVLDWAPEPTVVTDRADWTSRLRADLAPGARLTVRDHVVLGRSGQRGGRCRSELRVTHTGRPLMATSTVLDGADAALTGPGGSGGARSVGSLLVTGEDPARDGCGESAGVTWAWTALDGPGSLLTVVGEVRAVAAVLDREAAYCAGSTCVPVRSVERHSEQM